MSLAALKADPTLLAYLPLSANALVANGSTPNDGALYGSPSFSGGRLQLSGVVADGQALNLNNIKTSLGDSATIMYQVQLDVDPPAATAQTGDAMIGSALSGTPNVSHYPWTDGNVYSSTLRHTSGTANNRVTVSNPGDLSLEHWVTIRTTPGTNGWQWLLDGVVIAQATGLTSLYYGNEWRIGQSVNGSNNNFMAGTLRNVWIFSKRLSDLEVATIIAGDPLPLQSDTYALSVTPINSSGTFFVSAKTDSFHGTKVAEVTLYDAVNDLDLEFLLDTGKYYAHHNRICACDEVAQTLTAGTPLTFDVYLAPLIDRAHPYNGKQFYSTRVHKDDGYFYFYFKVDGTLHYVRWPTSTTRTEVSTPYIPDFMIQRSAVPGAYISSSVFGALIIDKRKLTAPITLVFQTGELQVDTLPTVVINPGTGYETFAVKPGTIASSGTIPAEFAYSSNLTVDGMQAQFTISNQPRPDIRPYDLTNGSRYLTHTYNVPQYTAEPATAGVPTNYEPTITTARRLVETNDLTFDGTTIKTADTETVETQPGRLMLDFIDPDYFESRYIDVEVDITATTIIIYNVDHDTFQSTTTPVNYTLAAGPTGTYTWTIVGGADAADFSVATNVLSLNTTASVSTKIVRVRATNSFGAYVEKDLTVRVNATPPAYRTFVPYVSLPQYSTTPYVLGALTTVPGGSYTYSRLLTLDGALFDISGGNLRLLDTNTSGNKSVTIVTNDGAQNINNTLTFTITPVIPTTTLTLNDNVYPVTGVEVGQFRTSPGTGYSYQFATQNQEFTITDNRLLINVTTPGLKTLTVRTILNSKIVNTKVFKVNVLTPPDITVRFNPLTFYTNQAVPAKAGTIDALPFDDYTFTTPTPGFSLVGNELFALVTPGYDPYDVVITTTSSFGGVKNITVTLTPEVPTSGSLYLTNYTVYGNQDSTGGVYVGKAYNSQVPSEVITPYDIDTGFEDGLKFTIDSDGRLFLDDGVLVVGQTYGVLYQGDYVDQTLFGGGSNHITVIEAPRTLAMVNSLPMFSESDTKGRGELRTRTFGPTSYKDFINQIAGINYYYFVMLEEYKGRELFLKIYNITSGADPVIELVSYNFSTTAVTVLSTLAYTRSDVGGTHPAQSVQTFKFVNTTSTYTGPTFVRVKLPMNAATQNLLLEVVQ